ncbi:Undecaprenyl-phosphate 4-deoxy-4-formamido-L-arabinose transferase (Undecaprenyl-phosphate Ara4FN transferase) (Ara4FN transferase) [Durusdinium trenchii]|uniref:Undecaprenyl-phosphate 4-deoxy-4-formamido-L-arabinose transferase (Undecaprenyl-phosphate Ara4FN transferase) (Ara4FN transferase) n=1 Tax=Durusdinium trenchii TaxID=1381693 RepID=A0ABP0HQY2_9DINO
MTSVVQGTEADSTGGVIVLIPVYNDWESVSQLLPMIDAALAEHSETTAISVLLVDDGSTEAVGDSLRALDLPHLARVDVLRLRGNVGHQRAIALGLSFVDAERPCRAVIVMDGDGEDDPADLPRLIVAFEERDGRDVVFAERLRRSEGGVFVVCYHLYRILHWWLTGIAVRVGNFSILPRHALDRLVVNPELWNHYAATVFSSRTPFSSIPTQRAERLYGQPRMNFVSLVTHGLSAISVFSDRVGVRLMLFVGALLAVDVLALGVTVAIRLWTNLAIPGWATFTSGLLIVLLFQLLTLVGMFIFLVLSSRNSLRCAMNDYVYVGKELDLFAHAVNWKAYVRSQLAPYIQGNVLEVGAGIGATTRMLCDGRQASWTCLEPDASLVERLRAAVDVESMGCPVEVLTGTLDALDAGRRFDCILYIDVLEHIEDDRGEAVRRRDVSGDSP